MIVKPRKSLKAADVAFTADETLNLLSKNTYTAAIIDIGLPGMDGLELVAHLTQFALILNPSP